jgi:hypothetical protein
MLLRTAVPIVLLGLLALGVEMFVEMRRHPAVRRAARLALLAIVAFPLLILLHGALSALVGGEEGVSFLAAVFMPLVLAVAILAVAQRLRHEPGATAHGFGIAGAGLGLLGVFLLLAMVASGLGWPMGERGVTSVAKAIVPLATLAVLGGAAYEAVALRPRSAVQAPKARS